MKKIVFLDIDGVLNSEWSASNYTKQTGKNGYGGWFHEEDQATKENVLFCETAFANLKKIVEATGAEIVISSTWRKFFSVEKFKEMFALYGWIDAPIVGKTKSMSGSWRGVEVARYLESESSTNYVILDDDDQFMKDQLGVFVQTDPAAGLTIEDADKAIKILNRTINIDL